MDETQRESKPLPPPRTTVFPDGHTLTVDYVWGTPEQAEQAARVIARILSSPRPTKGEGQPQQKGGDP